MRREASGRKALPSFHELLSFKNMKEKQSLKAYSNPQTSTPESMATESKFTNAKNYT